MQGVFSYMSVEAIGEEGASLFRRIRNFADWHFRGIRYIHVSIDPNSLPDQPCLCPLCGGTMEKVNLPYEFHDDSAPTPWPKSMFDTVGGLAQRTLSLVRR